jgi:hypothetical protein
MYNIFTFYVIKVCIYDIFRSQGYVTTDGQSASLSWNEALIWGLRPDLYYCQTVAGLIDVGRPL